MIRFDFQTTAVMVMATASSLSVAFCLNHADARGQARAETPVQASAHGVAHLRKAADGHFWADAAIEGRSVRALVDTGSSVVVLTREDAASLGLEPAAEDFTRSVQTASGVARAAPVILKSIAIAGVAVEDVQALVVDNGLTQSLLGMSYLGRLASFEATPVGLTLRS